MEKKIVVDIDIRAEDVKAASDAMAKARAETIEYNKQLNALKQEQKELNALHKVGAVNATDYAKRQTELKSQIAEANKGLREANKTLQSNKTVVEAAKGSNDQLRARLSLLTKEYNALSKNQRENTAEGQKMGATIKALSDKLKANEKAVGDNRRNVGNYSEAVKEFAGNLNVAGVNVGGLYNQLQKQKEALVALKAATNAQTAATGLGTQAMKIFKLALISTGIGAIVVLMGSLVAYFTQTKRGAELLDQGLAGLKATISVLVDRASALGEAVVNAFKNPKQALKDLGELIKSQIINRFTAIPALLQAVGKGFKALAERDVKGMKEAAKDAAQAVIQLNTGLDPAQQKKVADAIKGVAQEISEEAKAATDLTKQLQAIKDAERALSVETANRKAQVAELQLLAEDESKSNAERLDAIRKANAIQADLMNKQLELQRERVRVTEEQLALGENLEEDENALAEQRIRLGELEAENLKKLRTLKAKENSIINKEHAEAVKRENELRKLSEEEIKAEEEAAAKRAEIREEFRRDQLTELERRKEDAYQKANILREAGEEEKNIEKFLSQELIEIHRAEQDAILNDKIKHLEDLANEQKRKARAEIDDERIRAATILQIDAELAAAKEQLLDLEVSNYTASTEAMGFVDEERNALLVAQKQEVDAQIVELDRQKTEMLKAHQLEIDEARKQGNEQAVSALQGSLGTVGNILSGISTQVQNNIKNIEDQAKAAGKTDEEIAALTKKARKEAKSIAVAAALVQTFQAAIAAYQSGSAVPVVGVALGPIAAAAAVAFGLAQVANIKKQKFAQGGVLSGPSHAEGGIPLYGNDGGYYGEAEGNEIILTKGVYQDPKLRQIASDLNVAAGGQQLVPSRYMAAGGITAGSPTFAARTATASQNAVLEQRIDRLGDRIAEMEPVVRVSDINKVNGQRVKVQQSAQI